jgi:DNA-binding transcriptional LysR family regulator
MADIADIKAFLQTARLGSFSAAARQLGVAPSVMTKRVTRLEDRMGTKLLHRSTRRLKLTPTGEELRPRLQLLIGELDDVLDGGNAERRGMEGSLRIKAPTTVTALYLGEIVNEFHAANAELALELLLIDRSVNPMEEGFDVAIGALPASYANVVDEPLCPYERVLCAAPAYLARHALPRHPNELVDHDCLTFLAAGSIWSFESRGGPVSVEVRSKFSVNESRVLLGAVKRGVGMAILPRYLVEDDLGAGRLAEVLGDYPLAPLWLKALVPRNKIDRPAVAGFLDHLKARLQPVPPWVRTKAR